MNKKAKKIKLYITRIAGGWYEYETFKEATEYSPCEGEIVYEASLKKIGRIGKDDKFIPIKRRKK